MKKTVFIAVLALVLALSACDRAGSTGTPAAEQPAPAAEQPTPAETAPAPETQAVPATAAPASWPVRQEGERFEESIVILGLEETAHYEHIKNAALGFEMDYDYEQFTRSSDGERERFVTVWDDPGKPENYLELWRSPDDAETVAADIIGELSGEYDVSRYPHELKRAGSCIFLDASVIKGTNHMADQLQSVYIIPAADGCRIAAAHSFVTEAEGFFRRFGYMLDTLTVIGG